MSHISHRGTAHGRHKENGGSGLKQSTEELKLRQAARKVRVGVQLSGAAAQAQSEPEPGPRRRGGRRAKGQAPPPELALQLPEGAEAAEDGDKVSPLPSLGTVTGVSGKMKGALKSASAFYDATPRGTMLDEAAGGGGDDDSDEDVLGEELIFTERDMPEIPFDYVGCLNYVVFLMVYTFLAMEGRNRSTYQFAQFARDTGAVMEFKSLNLKFECAGCGRKEASMASRWGHERRCPYISHIRHWHNPATAGDDNDDAGTW